MITLYITSLGDQDLCILLRQIFVASARRNFPKIAFFNDRYAHTLTFRFYSCNRLTYFVLAKLLWNFKELRKARCTKWNVLLLAQWV